MRKISFYLDMDDALILLKNTVDLIRPLSDNDWTAFASIWKRSSAPRKTILTAQGDHERNLYFVTDGVQRVYYHDEIGREATLVFSYVGNFGGVIDSFICDTRSRYTYETLTRSEYLMAPQDKLKALMAEHPAVNTMITIGISHALSGLLERLVETQCYSSQEKFIALLKRSPHILNKVPHKYLANYLGIDPTNFSKLLNSIHI